MQVSNKYPIIRALPAINFKGITSDFSRQCYNSCDELEAIVEKYPEQKRMIGELPKEWTISIKNSLLAKNPNLSGGELSLKVAEKVVEFNNSLSEAAQVLRKNKSGSTEASVIFDRAFKSAGIDCFDSDKIIGEPIEKGNLSNVYPINKGGKQIYVFKVFHSIVENRSPSFHNFHGTLPEANRAAYWDKKAKGDNRVKFHFANPNSGFMINEYIQTNHPKPSKSAKEEYFGLHGDDDYHPDNSINGISIDYGGIKAVNKSLNENKTARYVYKKVSKSNNPEKTWSDFFKEYENEKNKDRKVGLNKGLVASRISSAQLEDKKNNIVKILKDSDDETKLSVIDKFEVFPEESRTGIFNVLAQNASNEIKQELVEKLLLLNPDDSLEAFKLLLQNANNEVKKGLVENIGALYPENWLEAFKMLAQDADEDLRKALSSQLNWLFYEDGERKEAEESLLFANL